MADNAELESFRRQWREEVARRTTHDTSNLQTSSPPSASTQQQAWVPPTHHELADRKEEEEEGEEEDAHGEQSSTPFDQSEIVQQVEQLNLGTGADGKPKEPRSALDHYELAVAKETELSLGDSVALYRKAYRLDAAVDIKYRNKHFAAAWKKPAQPTSGTSTGGPSAPQQTPDEPVVLPTADLIASFAHLPIPSAEPIIANTPPPPCPIAKTSSDVLIEIFKQVALMDPASFFRLSLVCKRFAYHFANEQHIWKRLCQGSEFGFKAMHYSFACDIFGHKEYTLAPRYALFPFDSTAKIPKPLATWAGVFQSQPRIRFTGIYISTVNYTRAGATSLFQTVSWNSPIHIVTYYRYLRFYPDGTVVSLLTTTAPTEIVPYISKENVATALASASSKSQHHRQVSSTGFTVTGAPDPVPPVAMSALKYAHRGRWRLTNPNGEPDSSNPDNQAKNYQPGPSFPGKDSNPAAPDPRDVIIETEGVGPKYIYTLHLGLRSSSSRPTKSGATSNSSKNTRLVWRGYWNYNKLSDEWSEFRLQNDRAFVFRRVRGWGMN